MKSNTMGGVVIFGLLGALCAFIFFANIGDASGPEVGANRLLGWPTWAFGLLGMVAAIVLIAVLLINERRNKG
ncbi:hypothetical protein [Microbacterium sp. BH-3-3-3]|uniref:hypothetical protein n=1 Tax=Microbacterium sp. BH-3-3-3 TaxID=1906742 RepID=UPI0011A12BCC|nr:hypothetical protein [Microbacterium sp. BH-3-3-3]